MPSTAEANPILTTGQSLLAKARAGQTFGCTSRQFAEAPAGDPFASVLGAPPDGGVVIKGADDTTTGAVGAVGGTPHHEDAVAIAVAVGA